MERWPGLAENRLPFSRQPLDHTSPRRHRKRYDPLLSSPLSPVPFSTVCQPLYSRARHTRILRQRLSAAWLTHGLAPSRLICSTIRHLNEDTIAFWIVLETNSERRRIRILLLACARNGTNRRGRLATESEWKNWIHASLSYAAYLNDVGRGGQTTKTIHYAVSLEKDIA